MKIAHDLQPIELEYYSLDERLNEANKRIMQAARAWYIAPRVCGQCNHRVPVCFGLSRMIGSGNVERYRNAVFRYVQRVWH